MPTWIRAHLCAQRAVCAIAFSLAALSMPACTTGDDDDDTCTDLRCSEDAVCGDGERAGDEECDGDDRDGETCASLGFDRGTLRCDDDCEFDLSDCERLPRCGDGRQVGDEECDLLDLDDTTCTDLGFGDGILDCATDCRFDARSCGAPESCGDNELQSPELCDGENLVGETCESLGYGPGALGCAPSCGGFDTSGCATPPSCGDGVKGGVEACDGDDFGFTTCESFGLEGELTCSADCLSISTASCDAPCVPACGDAECGDDGCGGSCGQCPGAFCVAGACTTECTPSCGDAECGDDGCGGSCGDCGVGSCIDGSCVEECVPSCSGLECGSDGCGGSCGTCDVGSTCQTGACVFGECPSGYLECGGACVEYLVDENNCGTCGVACESYPGVQCECVVGELVYSCANVGIIDPEDDPEHCGACGNTCTSSISNYIPQCYDGECVPACSEPYYGECGGSECENVSGGGYEPFKCGGCNDYCYPQNDEYTSCWFLDDGPTCSWTRNDMAHHQSCSTHCASVGATCIVAEINTTVTPYWYNDLSCGSLPPAPTYVSVTQYYPTDCWCYGPTVDRIEGATCQASCEAYGHTTCSNTQIPVETDEGIQFTLWRPCEPPYNTGDPDWVDVDVGDTFTVYQEPTFLSCRCGVAPE